MVESLQLKELIMEKARYSDDKKVREQALLALQKIMIQNWQNIWSIINHNQIIIIKCIYQILLFYLPDWMFSISSAHIHSHHDCFHCIYNSFSILNAYLLQIILDYHRHYKQAFSSQFLNPLGFLWHWNSHEFCIW